jgi:hypothetical protein
MKQPTSCLPASPGLTKSSGKALMTTIRAMWINFFMMNLFKAALTPELWSVVAQQEQETITIKRMYQVATTAQRELKGKRLEKMK